MGPEELRDLAPLFVLVRLHEGEALVRQGDTGADLYVVLKGRLCAIDEADGRSTVLGVMGPGSVLGEISYVTGGRRAATVRALEDAECARLPEDTCEDLLTRHPSVARHIAEQAHERLLWAHFSQMLEEVFGEVDDGFVQEIAGAIEWVRLPAGRALFAEGDPADAAYAVILGRIRLSLAGGEIFDEIGRGGLFGQSALLEGGVRRATAIAARDSYLVRLPRSAVEALEVRHPKAALRLTKKLLSAVRAPNSRRPDVGHTSIAVIAGTEGIDLRLFTTQLTEALSKYGPAFHVWGAKAESSLRRAGVSLMSENGESHIALTRWLHEQETAHRTLVYEADATLSPWSKLAVRQADRVVVVVDAADDSAGSMGAEVSSNLPEVGRPRLSLVALHGATTTSPAGTAAWLDAIRPDDHYHLRRGSAGDMERLARIIAGRAVALVLGGGGARGFGHFGAMRALGELGVPIDLVGGSSIGAILAALLASGRTLEESIEVAGRSFSRLNDYTLPATSLLKGKRTTKSMLAAFAEIQIEDLWLPYFCVTTNLTTNRADVHRRGMLVRALRASSAIPGVYPPVAIDGRVHIDGGVMNNLPADEMRRAYPDATIVAVDVAPPVGPGAKEDYGLWLSGMSVLLGRLRPGRRRRYPGLPDTLVRATVAASSRHRDRLVEEGVADLCLALDLRGVGPFDFDEIAPIAQRGYDQARPLIESWLERSAVPAMRV